MVGCTDISERELDTIILSYKATHPNDGEVMIIGHLRSCQICVPRSEVRQIHRVDFTGVNQRRHTTIQRRVYEVEAPNSVWHIDGNHKLIRWKLVIHGAIDGYSRLIPFLHCSTNNRAVTVHRLFVNAVSAFGLPHRVRTDGGGENVAVWEYIMAQLHRDNRCVIVGSSVHNVRIERLWRDVRRAVVDVYREVFSRLEHEHILDPDNDVDIFCLHEVFTVRINKSLTEFVSSWNNHPVSSESNMTPLQLFYVGLMESQENSSDDNLYTAPTVADHVQVPNLHYHPCGSLKSQLNTIQQNNSSNGYDMYRQVAGLVGRHLATNCPSCHYA